ncbi:hypothetical protein [Desulfosediminicola flagellatus]|uniref:hypothetical protein n=1 Tax=Desulfosediminicola flagellatus TaxID=2569541 RepID=UPI0010ACED6F|nr:hypothetical protein [Desulfosediminicola flagellatus]
MNIFTDPTKDYLRPLLNQLEGNHRTLLRYLTAAGGSIPLRYCQSILLIENPFEVARNLNIIGKEWGFEIWIDRAKDALIINGLEFLEQKHQVAANCQLHYDKEQALASLEEL